MVVDMEVKLFLGRLLIILGALFVAEVINLIIHYVKYKRYKNWKSWYTFARYMRDEMNALDEVCLMLICVAALVVIAGWLFEPLMN